MVTDDPELVNAPATSPPKKNDGQSPLQIALKWGQFTIADLLIERGADVNFIELSDINAWRTPVLHDAIRATVFSMRSAWATSGSVERLQAGIAILTKILQRGGDPNSVDSYGNTGLGRALLDLRQVLTSIPLKDDASSARDPIFDADAKLIVRALVDHGGDIYLGTESRPSAVEESCGRYFEKIIQEFQIDSDRVDSTHFSE